MGYLYLGFFIFLLFITAPWWVALAAAVVSVIAIRYSYTLRKNMRVNQWHSTFGSGLTLSRRKPTRFETKGGGVERRRFNRVATSLAVDYEVLGEAEKADVPLTGKNPSDVSLHPLIKHFKKGKAIVRDISEGGLAIVGEESFAIGDQLKLYVQFPEAPKPIQVQAMVRSCKETFKKGKIAFKTGLMIVDVDLEEFVHLLDYLFSQRG